MLTNSSIRIRIVFWLLIHSLIEVNCQLTPFQPLRRDSHTATFINDKLYILGGKLDNANNLTIGKQFFYLDVSASFNTQGLPWYDLTDINQVSPHDAAASVNGGANNETLFLYGGNDETNNDKTPLVYAFDTQSNSWNVPKITGDAAITRKFDLTGIVGDNRKMYLFGGDHSGGDVNDMLILDTIDLSWGKGSSTNAPTPREVYGATMIPNQQILYLGGFNDNSKGSLSLAEVYLYDTINDNWSAKSTTGTIPSNRDSFTVVLGLDGQRIIIFGGSGGNQGASLSPQDSLYVMDLIDYRWYVPKVSGDLPSSRHWHRSNVIKRYMVVSFGIGYDEDESDVLLLDISNNDEYTWTNVFDPALPATSTTSAPNSSTNSTSHHRNKHRKSVIIGAAIGSLIVSVSLSLGGFFIYKMNKIKRKKNHDPYDGYFEDLTIPAVISDRKKEVISTTRTIDDYVYDRNPSRAGNRREAMILNVDHKQKPLRGKETLTKVDEVYNDEREVTPRNDPNSSSSSPNINDVLERFKDELLQAFRQEVTQRSQVHQQVLTANDLENYKSEIDQAVKRQSMRQDFNINHLENYKHEILYAVMDEVIQKFKMRSNKI